VSESYTFHSQMPIIALHITLYITGTTYAFYVECHFLFFFISHHRILYTIG